MRILKTLVAVAMAYPIAASAATITNTRHDLAFSNTLAGAIKSTDSNETNTCKFCHTPHGAASTLALWNHAATAKTSFTWTDTTRTSGGTTLPSALASFKGGTLRCLGCHDGSAALGDINSSVTNIAMSGTIGMMVGNSAGAVGNLGNNHPVSIPYVGATNGLNPANFPGNGYVAAASACANSTTFCPTGQPLITLYGSALTDVTIECSSCHEPHNNTNGSFLRMANTGGALCKACHNK